MSNEDEEDDVAHVNLQGEGDWMHPDEDNEANGYDRDEDLAEKEAKSKLEELDERQKQADEWEAHKPSIEHEREWAADLASMSPDPMDDPENSPYFNWLPGMEEYYQRKLEEQQAEDASHDNQDC